jgi:hypothetical protein
MRVMVRAVSSATPSRLAGMQSSRSSLTYTAEWARAHPKHEKNAAKDMRVEFEEEVLNTTAELAAGTGKALPQPPTP